MQNDDFSVSVIIPVFKAEKFLERAVQKVLMQPEVTEIILVEDGSPDNSLDICRKLESNHSIVKVYQHMGGVNLGAAATRNEGFRHSTNEYIAFADADNFYLPERFMMEKSIFRKFPDADGVYNAQGIHYEDEEARTAFFASGLGDGEFLSLSEPVIPEEFLVAILGKHPIARLIGGLGIDAITLKRSAIDKAGLFSTDLPLQQDVYFFVKLAATCQMFPGSLKKPVAVRGVHGDMRSTNQELMLNCERLRWKLLDDWFARNVRDRNKRQVFQRAYVDFKIQNIKGFDSYLELVKSLFTQPRDFVKANNRFDINYRALFGNSSLALHLLSAKNKFVGFLLR